MRKVKFKIETNFNKKMGCDYLIHIDEPPTQPVTQKDLDETIFEMGTKDGSHPPIIVKCENVIITKAKDILPLEAWQSHGMSSADFYTWLFFKNKKEDREKTVAVYWYKKLHAHA